MSGTSYEARCPRCGKDMYCYSDWKPYDCVSGECLNCGFTYWTQEGIKTLKELNEIRKENELKLLKKLPKVKGLCKCKKFKGNKDTIRCWSCGGWRK